MDSATLKDAFSRVLSDQFSRQAKRVQKEITSHNILPLDKVSHWVEYGIATEGAKHRIPVWVKEGTGYWGLAWPHVVLWGSILICVVLVLIFLRFCLRIILLSMFPSKQMKSSKASSKSKEI
jgi:hypothetical protein